MVIFPHAKINIGLWITSKRPDGYHNIKTIFYPVKGFCDVLEFNEASGGYKRDNLTVTGFPVGPDTSGNLVLKALSLMRERFKIPFLDIHLHKAIPPGAGLGGGSSDAAFFISALNSYFSTGLTKPELEDIALSAGSDCPFFINDNPAFAEGRGEKMLPLDYPGKKLYILIAWPGINVSTREAYSDCTPSPRQESPSDFYLLPVEEWKEKLTNDFEKTVFKKHPAIESIRDRIYNNGAVFCSMSGSGSAVYGIFRYNPGIPAGMEGMTVYSGLL